MKKRPTIYQPLLSAFFGLLYVFILTPVQFWHQHPAKTSATIQQVYAYQYDLAADSSDADCSVCSHKYSGYELAFEAPCFSEPTVAGVFYMIPGLAAVEGIHFTLCNKGPPSLVSSVFFLI